MFAFPPQTAFGKPVPKNRIYIHAAPSRRVRDLFVAQISEIIWAYKLSPETLHLPAKPGVPEIQIFDIRLKSNSIDNEVLQTIDRAIPYPVIHRIYSATGVAFSAAYKRPSETDASQWIVGSRFTTPFSIAEPVESPLPVVLDLGHLYTGFFEKLLPLRSRPGESLEIYISRCETYLRLRRNIDQLTARLHREKQFNRKVALNHELRPLLVELEAISKLSMSETP